MATKINLGIEPEDATTAKAIIESEIVTVVSVMTRKNNEIDEVMIATVETTATMTITADTTQVVGTIAVIEVVVVTTDRDMSLPT